MRQPQPQDVTARSLLQAHRDALGDFGKAPVDLAPKHLADARQLLSEFAQQAAADQPGAVPRRVGTSRLVAGYAWADLMRRTFGLDVLACPRCGGRLRLVALIKEAAVIDRILRHLGLPTAIPVPRPARAPPLPVDVPDGSGWSNPPSGFDACS